MRYWRSGKLGRTVVSSRVEGKENATLECGQSENLMFWPKQPPIAAYTQDHHYFVIVDLTVLHAPIIREFRERGRQRPRERHLKYKFSFL